MAVAGMWVALAMVVGTTSLLIMHRVLWAVVMEMWWTPRRTKRIFQAQGIPCLPSRFLSGNLPELAAILKDAQSQPMPTISHDVVAYALPHYHLWTQQYGEHFIHWQGSQARLFLSNPDHIKEVLSTNFTHYVRLRRRPDMVNLLDNGLLQIDGERWAFHRHILSRGFYIERLKAMVPTMASCTKDMMEQWNSLSGKCQEIDVARELEILTSDIIAQTAFGSSYEEGKMIFELQQEQLRLAERISRTPYIPGARLLPTAFNRHCWKVEKRIEELTCKMIEKRLLEVSKGGPGGGGGGGKDLLGLMIDAMQKKNELHNNTQVKSMTHMTMGIEDIIGECKTFFLAGQETTTTLLSWTFLLLAVHDEWQERLRQEVGAVCGSSFAPTSDSLDHCKLVGMVLNEALRLYAPGAILTRRATTDMRLGELRIPKDTIVMVPVLALHHDEQYWGPDANEFRPERFSDGVAKAVTVKGTFLPFSIGPQMCIGQAFSLLEAKVVVAAILQRYRFRISPNYKHSPIYSLALQPRFGVPLLFEKI